MATDLPLGFAFVNPSELGKPSMLLAEDIDPETQDYRSLLVGADPVDAQAQYALSVVRGTGAAVQTTGMDALPETLDDSAATTVENTIRRALEPQRKLGDLRVESVNVSILEGLQAAVVKAKFTNLRARASNAQRMARTPPRRMNGV